MSVVPVPPAPSQEPPAVPPRTPARPSFVQVIASALAALTAAVLSGAFGVTGTFIGAAVASVVASVGSTLYLASIRNTHERLRRLAARQAWLASHPGTARTAIASADTADITVEPSRWSRLRWSELRAGLPSLRRRWIAVAGLAVVVFALAIGVLSGIEASTNKPVSALLGGHQGSGTSIGSVLDPKSTTPKPSPAPQATPTPVATPSTGVSPSASATPSPSAPASASESPAPSASPSPSESASPGPSATPSTGTSGTLATAP